MRNAKRSALMAAVLACMCSGALAGSFAEIELSFADRADTWQYMTVDFDYLTISADMQRNVTGFPAMAYKADMGEGLRYAEYDGSQWIETSIEQGFANGNMCLLRFSPTWNPMIVYRDSDTPPDKYFKYAWYNGSSWNIETFWTTAGNGLDAVVDGSGVLHVCFSNTFSDNRIYYGTRDSGVWTFEELGQATLWPVAIVLDGNGDPHTAWERGGYVIHQWLDGGTWYADSFSVADADAIDLEFGPDGSLHAMVHGEFLYYSHRTTSGWDTELVNDKKGFEGDMEIGDDGVVHIAIDEWSWRDLWYARKDSSGWYIENVSWSGSCGWSPSMYLDDLHNPHIFHSRNTSMEIAWWEVDTTGVEEGPGPMQDGTHFSLAGNPVSSSSNIDLVITSAGNYTLSLYDITGRLERVLLDGYLEESTRTVPFDPVDLPEGTYFLRLAGSGVTCCCRSLVVLH